MSGFESDFAATGRVSPVEATERLCTAVKENNVEEVRALLRQGADPNAPCSELKMLPVIYATVMDNPKMVEALVQAGANINACDANGDTPLFYAVDHSWELVERMIDMGANVFYKNKQDRTPADIAYENRRYDFATKLEQIALEQDLKDYSTAIRQDMDAPQRIQPRRKGMAP